VYGASKGSDDSLAERAVALHAVWRHTGARLTRHRRPGSVGGRVAAPAPAVGLGPELPLQLHQAPDPGAVGAEVRLDLGGQLADDGQVDVEQLRALLQRCRDRPAHVQVVPGPHQPRLSNTGSKVDKDENITQRRFTTSGPASTRWIAWRSAASCAATRG
jgi:hypothetical protein